MKKMKRDRYLDIVNANCGEHELGSLILDPLKFRLKKISRLEDEIYKIETTIETLTSQKIAGIEDTIAQLESLRRIKTHRRHALFHEFDTILECTTNNFAVVAAVMGIDLR
jgi:hypothetical protein